MKIIKKIPYDQVNFLWVSSHWDYHLNGICIYDNELCEFKTEESEWDYERDDYKETFMCSIFKLNRKEKISWLLRKKMFEISCGYHWTYKDNKRQIGFPQKRSWFYRPLYKLYYKFKLNKLFSS
jgi:hypothetical protein